MLLISSCSFDDKSGIWTSESEIAKKNNQFKDFETLYSSKEGFNRKVEIKKNFQFNIPPPINNIKWNDIYYNENNNPDNFDAIKVRVKSGISYSYNMLSDIFNINLYSNRLIMAPTQKSSGENQNDEKTE